MTNDVFVDMVGVSLRDCYFFAPPGLDNSGKSTLLHRLSQGQVTALQPTERPHIDEFQLGGISFKVRIMMRKYNEISSSII